MNITDYGAVPGSDISAATHAAMLAGHGVVPAGNWVVDPATGIKLDQPGMRLELEPGAIVTVAPTSLPNYAAVTISADDCTVTGPGTIVGDLTTHTGSTGEWGHGISIVAGGDYATVERVTVVECWGDGVYVSGGVLGAHIVDVTSLRNRRNGLSVVGATGAKIDGGRFNYSGTIGGGTAPRGGIYFEPNPNSGLHVIEFSANNVEASYNLGAGIAVIRAAAQTTRGRIAGAVTVGNGGAGVYSAGSTGSLAADVSDVTAAYNLHGVNATAPGMIVSGGHIYSNTQHGVTASAKVKLKGTTIDYNQRSGVLLAAGADSSSLVGVESSANSTSGSYVEVDIAADNCHVVGSLVLPSSAASWGVAVRSGATKARLVGSTILPGASGSVSAQADTVQTGLIKA